MSTKSCVVCNSKFNALRAANTCSNTCRIIRKRYMDLQAAKRMRERHIFSHLCPLCNKEFESKYRYIKFCSKECHKSFKRNQLLNSSYRAATIGKYEKSILDTLETCFGYEILRQYKVYNYFVDGYCPALNLAIEIDEPHHKWAKKDSFRQVEIENALNCIFLRIDVPN